MFTMMNSARLNVGIQGVAIAERAYQHALAYAQERRQGKSAWSTAATAAIIDQPDVRRMLALMKAKIEAGRAICLSTAVAADVAELSPDPVVKAAARLREDLFTPIAKAWCTDVGVEVASLGVQVHGGMGFVEETGAAQHYRDARIAPIYEGTNGIQAIDLAGRKLSDGDGEAVRQLVADMRKTLAALEDSPLADVGDRLSAGVAAIEAATAWMLPRRGSADALAGASAYLKLMGDVVGGWMLAKGALATAACPEAGLRAALARTYADQVLTGAPGLAEAAAAGAGSLEQLSAAVLAA
jgi:hypothetical protein